MKIRTKRVYDPSDPADGRRILVDRLWPRGLTKEAARVDFWAKGISPSNELRRWYGHDPEKWPEFKARYAAEIDERPEAWQELIDQLRGDPARGDTVTFVYSSKERELNNAVALKELVETRGW